MTTRPTRPRPGFVNETAQVIRDYGPDPNRRHAARLLHDTAMRVQGMLVRPWLGADDDPYLTFSGYGPGLQDFVGAASPASTGVTFRDGGNAEISSGIVEGPMGDPARRIFADRLRRGRPML